MMVSQSVIGMAGSVCMEGDHGRRACDECE